MERGIVVEDLTKIYRSRKRKGWLRSVQEEKIAVQDLNFTLPAGQVTGLLGLNGAGKTTTIKILSTLLLPTAGTVRVDDLDIVRDATTIRHRINMIAGGERMVYWRLTGRENLWYFAQLYNVEAKGLKERIKGLLKLVGLEDAADKPVERYSKGMKQRLQIARGLINEPTYLFLDEPTLGLDAPIARDLRKMIQRMADDGRGLLLTSHYLAEVDELCAYVYVIDQGRLIAEGSPRQLKTLTQQDRIVRVQLPELSPAVEEALREVTTRTNARLEVTSSEDIPVITVFHPSDLTGQVAAAIALHGGSMLKLEVLEPTLEDAMLALTSGKVKQEAADVVR